MITIHSGSDYDAMRAAGRLAAETLDYIGQYIKPGVTTNTLNDLCHDFIVGRGAICAPLGYRGSGSIPYPKSICTSVNHVICHGVPNDIPLKDGDIINIDVTPKLNGWHGDSSRMYYVGEPSIKAKRLVEVTYTAMMIGIDMVRPGIDLSDIGTAIEAYVVQHGYSVVRDYGGHGVGRVFHSEPSVAHYAHKSRKLILQEGMFFTIEPMINAGKRDTLVSKIDHWTVTTRDKSLSAQFEHSIGVTANGVEIFTLSPTGLTKPPYNH